MEKDDKETEVQTISNVQMSIQHDLIVFSHIPDVADVLQRLDLIVRRHRIVSDIR
jgi:hypothetical protein